MDVMGGIADYSGSLVLQLPIREAAICAIQQAEDRELQVLSPSIVNEMTRMTNPRSDSSGGSGSGCGI